MKEIFAGKLWVGLRWDGSSMINCVIFDFDGTLADTEKCSVEIYNELAEKYGYTKFCDEDVKILKQQTWTELFKLSGIPLSKIPKILKEGQSILFERISEIKPCSSGFSELISSLKKHIQAIGVISSNTRNNIEKFFSTHCAEQPDFILNASLFSKSSKINYILKKNKINSSEAIYVGDEIRDIEAAAKSNVRSVCVSWGYNDIFSLMKAKPVFIVDSFDELLSLIMKENNFD